MIALDVDLNRPAISSSAAAGVVQGSQLQAFALDSTADDQSGFHCWLSPWIPLPAITLDSAAGDRPGPGPAGDVQLDLNRPAISLDLNRPAIFSSADVTGDCPGPGPYQAGDILERNCR